MNDYGLVISPEGVDVNTCTPEEAIVDSRFNTFKVLINDDEPMFGSLILTCTTAPAAAVTRILTVHHGLGYRPETLTYHDRVKSTSGLTIRPRVSQIMEIPTTGLDGYRLESKADENDFWIDLTRNSADTPNNLIGKVIALKYYIFVEDVDSDIA